MCLCVYMHACVSVCVQTFDSCQNIFYAEKSNFIKSVKKQSREEFVTLLEGLFYI